MKAKTIIFTGLALSVIGAALAIVIARDCEPKKAYAPPDQVRLLSPANGAVNTPVCQALVWGKTRNVLPMRDGSFEIYLGRTPELGPDQFRYSMHYYRWQWGTGILDHNTTYYWRVDAKNSLGMTKGQTWSFTTGPAPSHWNRQFGSSGSDRANGVVVDAANNVYVAGTARDLDNNHPDNHYDNPFIVKYDPAGVKQWLAQEFSQTTPSDGIAVAVDSANNVYLLGRGFEFLGPDPNAGVGRMFLAKYDPAGKRLWLRQFLSSDDNHGGIAVDSNGNIYVATQARREIDGQKPHGDSDALLIKYDSVGNRQWVKLFGSGGDDAATGIAIDKAGHIYISGATAGSIEEGVKIGGYWDAFVAKFSPDGNLFWVRQFGSLDDDWAEKLALDSQGMVCVVGRAGAGFDGNVFGGGYHDAIIVKYDPAGNKIWSRVIGTGKSESADGVTIDAQDNIYMVGTTNGKKKDTYEGFVIKYGAGGNQFWTRTFGAGWFVAAHCAVVDSANGIYICGVIIDDAFDGCASSGGSDGFVIKYDSDGNRK